MRLIGSLRRSQQLTVRNSNQDPPFCGWLANSRLWAALVVVGADAEFRLRSGDIFQFDVISRSLQRITRACCVERVTPGYRGATELREMLRILHAGEELRVNSLEGPYHAWTFVEDVAEAIERAWATPNLPNDIYTITCGQQYSIGDMLAAFKRAWPEIAYRVVPASDANYHVSGDPPGPRPSNARMQQDFGWIPSTPLDEGVQQYLDWIRANGPQ